MSTPAEPVQPATPPPPQQQPTGQAPAAQPQQQGQPFQGQYDPDRAARLIENLRGDLTTERERRQQAEQQQAQQYTDLLAGLQAAGINVGQNPTPEQLQQQLAERDTAVTAAQQQAADDRRELAILQAAQKLGANSTALLDSRAFMQGVSGLDTADRAALAAAVEQRLTEAMTANPALRAGPSAGRSGADMGGGGGSGDGALTLDAQIEAAQKAGNIGLSMRLKRHRAAQQTT